MAERRSPRGRAPRASALLGLSLLFLLGVPAAGTTPAPSMPPPVVPERLTWEVVRRIPHDTEAFTQGLLFDGSGRLWESTGLWGLSTVRELDPATGSVLRSIPTPDGAFGEGLAIGASGELVQLTWQEGIAWRYDPDTLTVIGSWSYAGEGWGLCSDGSRLVMSDGSPRLTFRDPATFLPTGEVTVTRDGLPVARLNELECADGAIWANIWMTDEIVRIDPASGIVTGILDLAGLLEPHPTRADPAAVLNGITRVPDGPGWLITGKLWPEIVEIVLSAPG